MKNKKNNKQIQQLLYLNQRYQKLNINLLLEGQLQTIYAKKKNALIFRAKLSTLYIKPQNENKHVVKNLVKKQHLYMVTEQNR